MLLSTYAIFAFTKLTECVVNQIMFFSFHQLKMSTADVLERGEYLILIFKST